MTPRALLVAAAVLAHSSVATACSCARLTLEELIEDPRDLAIFSARVVSVVAPERNKPTITRFAVGDVIKGPVSRVIEMIGITSADHACGVDLRPGEVRTIAAYRKDGRWFTDMCLIPQF